MPMYDDQLEFRPRAEQQAFTRARLLEQARYTVERSPFYRRRLAGRPPPAAPADLARWLRDIALTTRADLERENDAFRACPPAELREIVATSGTSGAPINLYLTRGDLEKLAICEAYAFRAAGFAPGDTVQLAVTMDTLFMAGLAYYLGLQRIGCAVLRQGPANPARQLEIMRRNRVTGIVTVPSFLLALAREWAREGRPRAELELRRAVLVGENLRTAQLEPNAVARRIREIWDIELYGSYGNSEMTGSMSECAHGCGTHIHPDMVYVEILDEHGAPCPPGEPGALVVTPLNAEGTPLLRYRTGDIAFVVDAPCRCGRHSPRLGPVLAREGQMLKIKGTKVYPAAISEALSGIPEIESFVIIAESDEHHGDRVRIVAATTLDPDPLAERLAATLRFRPRIECDTRENIQRLAHPPGYRKKLVFIDRRHQGTDRRLVRDGD